MLINPLLKGNRQTTTMWYHSFLRLLRPEMDAGGGLKILHPSLIGFGLCLAIVISMNHRGNNAFNKTCLIEEFWIFSLMLILIPWKAIDKQLLYRVSQFPSYTHIPKRIPVENLSIKLQENILYWIDKQQLGALFKNILVKTHFIHPPSYHWISLKGKFSGKRSFLS